MSQTATFKLGIFGGTFNPPHKGHIAAANRFCAEIAPDLLYILPAGIPPHKTIAVGDNPAHRFRMAQLAFGDLPCDKVFSAIELVRRGKSYTVDTLATLSELHPDAELYLYVGSDMLFGFEKWVRFEEILQKVTLVTAPRSEADRGEVAAHCRLLAEKYGCRYHILALSPFEISSTELRNDKLFETGGTVSGLSDEVAAYIRQYHLYEKRDFSAATTDDTLRLAEAELALFVDEKRRLHTLSVRDTALLLGKRFLPLYGEEFSDGLRDLAMAALCHDMTKCKSDAELYSYLSRFMRNFQEVPSVYHSYASAYFALERYHVNARVFRSIYAHTTGHADMDLFEKILFIADYIEPLRTHESCRKAHDDLFSALDALEKSGDLSKETATEALDRVIFDVLCRTERYLADENRPICRELYEARDFLAAHLRS